MTGTWPTAALAAIFFVANATNLLTAAQQPTPPAQSAEVAASQTEFKIRTERNLVVVRVVVRDSKGNVVSGLHKEDFRLFDNAKQQTIASFSVEAPGAKATSVTPASATQSVPETAPGAPQALVMPDRFVALFFDDIHIAFEDLARTRNAADHYIANNLRPADRAAIFTASGQDQLDFTADRQKLHDALFRLRQHPMPTMGSSCPEMTDYQAYKIAEQHDPTALQVAQADALATCCPPPPPGVSALSACSQANADYLEAVSRGILTSLETSSRYACQGLEGLCRRMELLSGQRSIVLLSPGFFTNTETYDVQQVVDRALRAGVVINTLDARGLYVDIPGGDASQRSSGDPQMFGLKSQIQHESMLAQTDVLASLASGTGGIYFHDSNDYDAGFRRTGGLPDAGYVLTFSPQDLKFDGSFHRLKVTLANPSRLVLQARLGYYAPRKAEDAAAQAQDEINEAVFSRNEMNELPIDLKTSFFKADNLNAKLSVVAHIDLSSVRFRKSEGRNLDDVTLIAALFDSDGNYVTGTESTVEMHLHDATLTRIQHTGIFLKANLEVKVGTYLMRVIVRDAESTRISTLNRTLEIPY